LAPGLRRLPRVAPRRPARLRAGALVARGAGGGLGHARAAAGAGARASGHGHSVSCRSRLTRAPPPRRAKGPAGTHMKCYIQRERVKGSLKRRCAPWARRITRREAALTCLPFALACARQLLALPGLRRRLPARQAAALRRALAGARRAGRAQHRARARTPLTRPSCRRAERAVLRLRHQHLAVRRARRGGGAAAQQLFRHAVPHHPA